MESKKYKTTRLESLKAQIKNAGAAVLVGAGGGSEKFIKKLHGECKNKLFCVFDNNTEKQGKTLCGIPVKAPYSLADDYIYIITVENRQMQEQLKQQLLDLKIPKERIMSTYKDYEYYSSLDESCYQAEIDEKYKENFGRSINWENPQTYNEIINWEKIYAFDARKTSLADKILVRDWVKEKIGEEYLTKYFGVYDDAGDIPFDELPDSFALKVNNASGRNIIVKDKNCIDKDEIRKQLTGWMKLNYFFDGAFERQYRDITPKIICEEYLEGVAENVYDYNIYCFHGKPKFIWCIKASHKKNCQASFYDLDWNMLPFSFGYPKDPIVAPRPKHLEKMLELSEILSKDFKHVRVDWYDLPDDRVLFCEITFASWGGFEHFTPEEYDLEFGRLIREG